MVNLFFIFLNTPFIKRISSFFFACIISICVAYGQTTVIKDGIGYTFMRDGKPYYVKGLGGDVNLDRVVEIGGNSIRTWGVDNAQQVLDEAQKKGLTVMLGMWMQHERHGFNYDDKDKVLKQLNYFKTIIDKYKNHPALLMWGIGNELDLQYSNTNVWYAVQDIAKYAHQVDPNHPTSTVTAGMDSMKVQFIKNRCPDIDVYCINTYGDIAGVPANIERYGWTGPYMITEWGPTGWWESPNTSWKVAIEPTSSDKKKVYYDRYENYIAPYKKCLGSYAFAWSFKQEYTETWFGLFSKDNNSTEPIDALEMVFTNHNPSKPAPTITSMTIENKTSKDEIKLKADEKFTAAVNAKIGLSMKETSIDSGNQFIYKWKILAESTDKKTGGDAEQEADEIRGLIKHAKSNQINFRTPASEGAYRLFVEVEFNNKVAYANIPFWVDKRDEKDGQAKFIEFKKTNMDSFNQ